MKRSIDILFGNWGRIQLCIFTAALLVRVAFVLTLQDGFYFLDSAVYSEAAMSLLTNGELGASYNRPPGYPVFIAGIYLFFGESILAIRIVESVIGAFLAVVIALLARRIGGQTTGTLAGLLWSIYPIGIFIVGLVYPTNPFTMLLACGVACLLPYSDQELSPKRIFLTGILWGLAALTIPIVIITIGIAGLWIVCCGRVNRFRSVFLLLIGSALTILPWMIRDYYAHGTLVIVEPRIVEHLPRVPSSDDPGAILKSPSLFVGHLTNEFVHFWKLYPDRITMDRPGVRDKAHEKDRRVVKSTIFTTGNLIKTVSILSTAPLFFFAIIGTVAMWFQRERRRDLWLLWGVILSFAVGYSVFYTKTRYRIPIEPYIAILSAYGLNAAWSLARNRVLPIPPPDYDAGCELPSGVKAK